MKSLNYNKLAKELRIPKNLLTKILIQKGILTKGEFNNLLPTKFAIENEYGYTILVDGNEEIIITSWGIEFIVEMLETQYCAVI